MWTCMFTNHTVLFIRFVVIVISLALYSWDRILLYRADCSRTQAGVCLSLHWELGFHVRNTIPGYSLHIFTVSMLEAVSAKGWLYFKTFKNQQGMDDLRDDKDTEPKLLGIWKIGLLSLNCSESVSCVWNWADSMIFFYFYKSQKSVEIKWYCGYECPL